MSRRRSQLEKKVQADIEADLGAEPDLLLFRNSVGKAHYVTDEGKEYFVPYGLGEGSPDIVGQLRVELRHRGPGDPVVVRTVSDRRGTREEVYAMTKPIVVAVWFCLEVKPPENPEPEPHQRKIHNIWRRFGAFVDTVHSVAGARAALERARRLGW